MGCFKYTIVNTKHKKAITTMITTTTTTTTNNNNNNTVTIEKLQHNIP
jgi:hypothetical protein